MAQLTLAGRSDDGFHLRLLDDDGHEHTLAVDGRLKAALQGVRQHDGQLELQMESTLRPRDIQNRIRAGESPETVAQAAQTSVDKIMPFAAPVLAERAHVAQRAQDASVRRRGGDGARTLGEAVATQLRHHNVDPESVVWDAWRREDGRWTLVATYTAAGRGGQANFSFDARGNYATLDDDDARWLVGDLAPAADLSAADLSAPPADDIAAARARRLTAITADPASEAIELPLGEDAISMVGDGDETSEIERVEEPESVEEVEEPAAEEPPAPKPAKRRGRASVPSWDEIMFGGGKGE